MAVRIKDDAIPYKGGIGIEITDNHIINVLLREANNLIHVNENNELYVDLQLDEGIAPDDDFPVGVTTGKILQSDGWQQSGLILNRKTTSGDYARLIYANDGNLYVDLGDGVWRLIGSGTPGESCNTRTFYLPSNVTDVSNPDLTEIQNAMDWYFDGKDAILWLDEINGGQMYVFYQDDTDTYDQIDYRSVKGSVISWESRGTANYAWGMMKIEFIPGTHTVQRVRIDSRIENEAGSFIPTNVSLREWFYPTALSHPIALGYLNQELAKKQDVLTAGTRITIQTDPNTGNLVISADVSGVMTYKGNVTDSTQLPSTGQQVGDCWYSISDGHLYAWDGTQWNDIGSTSIDLTNYFNKNSDTSDNITQGTTNLFVTQQEKNTWNGKQDQLIAGQNITIDQNNIISATDTTYTAGDGIVINGNNVISNDAPFDPDNAGAMGQVLTKTSNGYEWKNPATSPYTAGRGINIDQNDVISNTGVLTVNNNQPDVNGNVNVKEFDPDNAGSVDQVLKKTINGYEWKNEAGGNTYTAGTGINIDQNNEISNTLPFDPDNIGATGNVLKKTNQGYEWDSIKEFDPSNQGQNGQVLKTDGQGNYYWANESGGGGQTYYGGTGITIDQNNYINNDGVLTVNGNSPDQNGNINVTEFEPDNIGSNGQVLKRTANGYEWANESGGGTTYYAGDGIDIDSNNVISNEGVLTVNNQHPDASGNINVSGTNYTAGSGIRINSNDEIINDAPFDPDNIGSAGQVLKKTQNGYEWQNESGGGTTYYAGDYISIDSNNEINNTAPFTPGSGSVGQVLTKTQNGYEWSNISSSSNVKLFILNSSTNTTPDLTVAQEALDWYNAGKLPIIKAYKSNWAGSYSGDKFFLPDQILHVTDPQAGTQWDNFEWHSIYNEDDFVADDTNGYTALSIPTVILKIESGDVTQATVGGSISAWEKFVSTDYNYTNSYQPLYNGSPATKKYVDDRNWVGTQAEYNALTTIDPTVIYNIIL